MTIYNESKKYGWILSPVTFHIYNKDREADYEDGFHPDVAIDEFKSDLAEFGDLKDPLLGQAIYRPVTALTIRYPEGQPGNPI